MTHEDHKPEFLLNTRTREIHHLPYATEACQIAKIIYGENAVSLKLARERGYDICGHCFKSKDND